MYRPPTLLSPMLMLPAMLFEAVARTRDLLYSAGVISPSRLSRPVISIGNLTLGGSGKTPLVIYVAAILARNGHPVAVLSRGYGRHAPRASCILPPGETTSIHGANIGDEPALIHRHLPDAWLGISANRFRIGQRLLKTCAELVFVLDDGFQHRQLHRDLDIVVIDRTQSLRRNHLFPRGSLREPVSSLRRSHAVVLTGREQADGDGAIEGMLRGINPQVTVFHCLQELRFVPFEIWNSSHPAAVSPASCPADIFLAAAIGNPARFRNDVAAFGIRVAGSRFFRDHHALTRRDWQECVREAKRYGTGGIAITEKDAVKIEHPPDFPLYVAVQSTSVERPAEFERMIMNTIRGRS